ncbi:DNA-binding transcriptional regulator YdaS (Cro superfamily) [Sphingomonas jinjuensis]|uniref:DNA-binding transcriptional regulator YdaS (Cro superfamily) n=1 Tax=Sphingomonas jinjuensis TaxID=535907 RepID=A0A840F9F4_9SPHN|nr:YdaS family helix-turn-helix protein [Sphingomonas jinjuensis]MBB4152926.1 DNA-binding transcriptional regulator YdaS (Cro superfamily) [Sphingomonas jinjuensis]
MGIETQLDSPLARAVRLAGSQSAFARLVGRSQATVYTWLSQGKLLPAELVLAVEAATGVSRNDLRPDLYPRESAASTAGLEVAR